MWKLKYREIKVQGKQSVGKLKYREIKAEPSQDLNGEGRKRSVWWHTFLIETGDIELGDTNHD